MFDDFDILASEVMTLVALEGQTTATQRKIAGLLRDTASPPSLSPQHLPGCDGGKNPRQIHESLAGEQFEKEIV